MTREGVATRLFGRAMPLRIGRFELGDKLGSGGMGEVWSAFDPALERRVALKTLHASDFASEARRRDLVEEARTLARLRHPNLLAVHDVLEIDELVVIVLELVEGESLTRWAARRTATREQRLAALEAAGRGLIAAHEAGVVHLDFKPDNVLVEPDGRVLVVDFGLAWRLDRPRSVVGGTPGFAAPEQLVGGQTDARADQFAFAATVCAVLGAPLERRDVERHERLAAALARLGLGRARARVLLRALELEPERRWPSMAALVDALFVRPRVRARRRLLGGGLVLSLALGVGSRWLVDEAPPRCSVPAERWLADAWDVEQRETFLAAAGSEPAFEPAARVAASLLDARRRELELEWPSMCETSLLSSGDAIATRRCAERRRSELAAVARLLAHPSDGVLERAPRIAAELGTLADCSLAARATSSPRTWSLGDLDTRGRLHGALAEAEVHRHAGERELQRAALQRAELLARSLGDRLALAELDVHLGRMAVDEGHIDAGLQQVERGYFGALAGGDELLAADTASRLVFLAGAEAQRDARGSDWAAHAEALFDKLDVDPIRRARLAAHRGAMAESSGDANTSLGHYRQALAQLEGVDAPELRLVVLHGIAIGLQARDEPRAALATFAEIEPLMRAEYGDRHPHRAVLLNNVGATRQAIGEFEAALHDHEAAREIAEARGLDRLLVSVLTNSCFAHNSSDQAELGLADCLDAVALCLDVFGPSEACGGAYMALGNAWASLGAGESALAAYRVTFELDAARFAVDDSNLAWAWSSLGAGQLAVGDWIAAADAYERALELARGELPLAELAELQFGLARAHDALGLHAAATELAARASEGFAAAGHRRAAARARAWLVDRPPGW